MDSYPEPGEFVVAKVKKILPFGAILALEEYGGQEAFVHISEVFSGWVRNIRDHVKEGQVTVGKVISVDTTKRQIDVSLKRASESDKKRKIHLYQSNKRAIKMLEVTAQKLGKPMAVAMQEVVAPMEEAYGDLYSGFEALSKDEELKARLPKAWIPALTELAKKEIKQKRVTVRAILTLKCYASDGLKKIKDAIFALKGRTFVGSTFVVSYVSAPTYHIDVEADDYKRAEKIVGQLAKELEAHASGSEFESSLEVQKA